MMLLNLSYKTANKLLPILQRHINAQNSLLLAATEHELCTRESLKKLNDENRELKRFYKELSCQVYEYQDLIKLKDDRSN